MVTANQDEGGGEQARGMKAPYATAGGKGKRGAF